MSIYSVLVLASSPRVYYRLADTSNLVARDETGNKYDGIIHGGVTQLQQNAIITDYSDYAMLFTANAGGTSGGYILCPSALSTNGLSALTVECWVYLTSNTYTYFPFLLASDANPASSHVGFRFDLAPASAGVSADFVVGNGTTGVNASYGTTTLGVGVWSHLVGVYNGSSVWIYVNGIPGNPLALTGTVGTATHSVSIGVQPSLTGNFLSGTLDEIAIYPSALSATTILSHWTTGNFGRTGITLFPAATRRQT